MESFMIWFTATKTPA